MSPQPDVVYALDASDAITAVNDSWISFASANGGEALLPPAIIGRSVWDFIADPTTRMLYRRIFERVRAGTGPVRFSLQCDAPALRRLLEMTISRDRGGSLKFVVHTLALEPRAPERLLDRDAPRSNELVRMCAWCKRIPGPDGAWGEVDEMLPKLGLFDTRVLPRITHGICEDCDRMIIAELEFRSLNRPDRTSADT